MAGVWGRARAYLTQSSAANGSPARIMAVSEEVRYAGPPLRVTRRHRENTKMSILKHFTTLADDDSAMASILATVLNTDQAVRMIMNIRDSDATPIFEIVDILRMNYVLKLYGLSEGACTNHEAFVLATALNGDQAIRMSLQKQRAFKLEDAHRVAKTLREHGPMDALSAPPEVTEKPEKADKVSTTRPTVGDLRQIQDEVAVRLDSVDAHAEAARVAAEAGELTSSSA